MQIGQEADAQARERLGQARDAERRARHLDVVALVEETVRRRPRRRPDATAASPRRTSRRVRLPGAREKAYVIIWATSHHFHLR